MEQKGLFGDKETVINTMIISGGKNIYGYDVGILMLETHFPRIIGDVGNVLTWNFPVLYSIVRGSVPKKVVLDLNDDDLLPFIHAAQELETSGVRAITTSCGFLALFQEKLSKFVTVPIYTSSLMLLPTLLCAFYGKNILILTANSETLTDAHLQAVGIDVTKKNESFFIYGMQEKDVFTNFTVENWDYVDTDACQKEILDTVDDAMSKRTYACILLECTNMPPYSDLLRKKFGLPVFDFVSLVNFIHSSFAMNNFKLDY